MFFWVYAEFVAKHVDYVTKTIEMFEQNVKNWDFVSHYTY